MTDRRARDVVLRDLLVVVKRDGTGSSAVLSLFQAAQPLIRSWVRKMGVPHNRTDDVFAETHVLILERIESTPEHQLSVRTINAAVVAACRHALRETITPLTGVSDSTVVKVKAALTKCGDDPKKAAAELFEKEKVTESTFWCVFAGFSGGWIAEENWPALYSTSVVTPRNYAAIQQVRDVIGSMDEPYRTALTLRMGIGGQQPRSFLEIADELGITERKARRAVETSLKKFARLYSKQV